MYNIIEKTGMLLAAQGEGQEVGGGQFSKTIRRNLVYRRYKKGNSGLGAGGKKRASAGAKQRGLPASFQDRDMERKVEIDIR